MEEDGTFPRSSIVIGERIAVIHYDWEKSQLMAGDNFGLDDSYRSTIKLMSHGVYALAEIMRARGLEGKTCRMEIILGE